MTKLTSFSQIDTQVSETKCIKKSIVKEMIKDILRGDEAIAQLVVVEKIVDSLETKTEKQKEIITELENKNESSEKIIEKKDKQIELLQLDAKNTQKKLKKEKLKNSIKTFTSVGIIAVLGYLLIIK
jgi:hypothetical protein